MEDDERRREQSLMLYGSVKNPAAGYFPTGVHVCATERRVKFFLGDHWETLGRIEVRMDGVFTAIMIPDVEEEVERRLGMEEGAKEWLEWGPRNN